MITGASKNLPNATNASGVRPTTVALEQQGPSVDQGNQPATATQEPEGLSQTEQPQTTTDPVETRLETDNEQRTRQAGQNAVGGENTQNPASPSNPRSTRNSAPRAGLATQQTQQTQQAQQAGQVSQNAANPPGGFIAQAGDLTEAREQEIVRANGGRGVLVPYGRYDPTAEPLVIVHGVRGAPSNMRGIIDRYSDPNHPDRAPGERPRQVYIYYYDDRRSSVPAAGRDLANHVGRIGERHRVDHNRSNDPNVRQRVQIVGHSMGGIVSREAMNQLSQRATARNFDGVDLVSIDTPWHGHAGNGPTARQIGERYSWGTMGSRHPNMQQLNRQPLPSGWTMNQIEASEVRSDPRANITDGYPEYSDAATRRMVRHIRGDRNALRGRPRLQNMMSALQADQDYPELRRRIMQQQDVTPDEFRQMVQQHAVPRIEGHHSHDAMVGRGRRRRMHRGVLDNPALLPELDRTLERNF